MSDLNVNVLDKAFHNALRLASAHSFGSLVMPFDETAEWPPRRARMVPPLKQWILERDDFEEKVVSGYTDMEDGAIRQLVAGTGVGKSTTMPYKIASAKLVSGLVLVPNNVLPVMCMPFLKLKFGALGGTVRAEILRTAHADRPVAAPCVYFCSAVDFLARLARRPTLLTDIGIDFIFLDESHETRPDYTVFKYIKHVGILGDTKIFYGTATAAADVNMESGGVGRQVFAKDPGMFDVTNPSGMTPSSPLHYSNMQDRMLLFVANDVEAAIMVEYYDTHDVPVMAHLMETGDSRLGDIPDFLTANSLCVLVVNALFQTGFTLNIDTVCCSGYVSELVADFANSRMEIRKRPVTQAERTQRMGRVGRYKPGRGFYANVGTSPPLQENCPEKALYTYLWCKVFNISMNEPAIAMFSELTGGLTPFAAAMLLHSRVHPYLMLPFVADDGFYQRWGKVMRYALYSSVSMESDDSNADRVESWKQQSTGPVDYSRTPIQYKTAVQFPKEWAVIPAVAWNVYTRQEDARRFLGLSSRSVISAVPSSPRTVRSVRTSSVSSPPPAMSNRGARQSVSTLPRYSSAQLPRYSSASSVARSVTQASATVDDTRSDTVRVPTIRELQSAYSVQNVIPPVRLSEVVDRSDGSVGTPSLAVQSWREQLPPSPRLPGRRQSTSGSSSEREEIPLKQVDPERYANYKLYPVDPAIFADFVLHESVSKEDHRRVSALLSGKRDFSALADDSSLHHGSQHVYFTSVLRVHNSALSRRLQITANIRPGMLSRMLGSMDGELDTVNSQIISTVRLLKACALQSFFVGVDRRTLHASVVSSSVVTPVYTEYESQARIMLSFGDPRVVKDINRICRTASPIIVEGKYDSQICVANAWHVGNAIFSVAHVCEERNSETWPEGALGVRAVNYDHDIIVFDCAGNGDCPYMRHADDSESVYVLYYDQNQGIVNVLGVFNIDGRGDPLIMDFLLTHGCSGALVVATKDGAVVGMYRGEYSVGTAWVVPIVYVKDMVYP